MKRNNRKAHGNHERWLVSYADFITLMFAFFVVLYASSQTDIRKQAQVAQSINEAFKALGLFQPDSNAKSGVVSTDKAATPLTSSWETSSRRSHPPPSRRTSSACTANSRRGSRTRLPSMSSLCVLAARAW